jgi:hypothetical protein
MALYNRVKVAITAGGTGNLTIGAAPSMFRSFAGAGVPDGTVVSYVIEDSTATAWEYGRGTYTAPSTFARTTVLSTNAGNTTPINAGATAFLFIDALAEDFVSSIGVGTTPIGGGTPGRVLFNNGGNVGEAANLTYDGTNTVASAIKLKGATSGFATVKSAPTTTDYTLTLPNAVATVAGQSLTSDTNGNLSWTTETPATMTFAATSRVLGRNTAGAGTGEELTASQVLDWIGATQGQVLYRSTVGWTALSAGTAGQYLKTAGTGANPAWADLPPYAVTAFAPTKAYVANDIVSNAGKLYSAKTGFTSGATFVATDWNEIGSTSSIMPYAASKAYTLGDLCSYSGNVYRCILAYTTDAVPTWDAPKWIRITNATFTAGSVPFAGADGALTEANANLKFDAVKKQLTVGGDALINGATVGLGGGSIATNTVVGAGALAANTTGTGNVAVGDSALAANTGSQNTAVGSAALAANTTGANNVAIGKNALAVNNSGNNTAVGTNSLLVNTTGSANTAIGAASLFSNIGGIRNSAVGAGALQNNNADYNTAIGSLSLFSNTTGTPNTAVGYWALRDNQTGTNNVAVGDSALTANTANNNTAVGSGAMASTTTGNANAAFGFNALNANIGGVSNSAFGILALASSTTGLRNSAFGAQALQNTNGSSNTAVGHQSMFTSISGDSNTALGFQTLYTNTANNNTAVGSLALYSNTTGTPNTAVGYNALNLNVSGTNNVAVGDSALAANTGNSNNAFGSGALAANTTGGSNCAFGHKALGRSIGAYENAAFGHLALELNTGGQRNVAVGKGALQANTNALGNVAVGWNSLLATTTGAPNTAVGYNSLVNNLTGANNVAVGDSALAANTGNNNVAIGSAAGNDGLISIVAQNNHVVIGNNSTTNAICKVTWATTSDIREKEVLGVVPHGLDFVNALPTIAYKFKKDRADANAPVDAPLHYGFPAQDILALEGTGVIVNADDPEHLRLNSADLIPVLVNAIKELSAELAELKAKVQ